MHSAPRLAEVLAGHLLLIRQSLHLHMSFNPLLEEALQHHGQRQKVSWVNSSTDSQQHLLLLHIWETTGIFNQPIKNKFDLFLFSFPRRTPKQFPDFTSFVSFTFRSALSFWKSFYLLFVLLSQGQATTTSEVDLKVWSVEKWWSFYLHGAFKFTNWALITMRHIVLSLTSF